MNFPYNIFDTAVVSLVVYLLVATFLLYKVKKLYPEYFRSSYPYGFMNQKRPFPVFLSQNFFTRGITTLIGHWNMVKILLTSKFSENHTIRNLKIILRILLVIVIIMFVLFIITIANTPTV